MSTALAQLLQCRNAARTQVPAMDGGPCHTKRLHSQPSQPSLPACLPACPELRPAILAIAGQCSVVVGEVRIMHISCGRSAQTAIYLASYQLV